MTRRSIGSRFLAAVVVLLAGWMTLAPTEPAGAHAVLVGTSPEPGALLDGAPARVEVTFNEPISAEPDGLVVIDEAGEQISGEASTEGATLSAPFPEGATGWFAVTWSIVSADGHPLSGAWTFRVGEGSAEAPQELLDRAAEAQPSTAARWGWTLAQWASALTAVVLVGTTFVMVFAEPLPAHRRMALAIGAAGAVAAVAAAAVNGPHVGVGAFHGPAGEVLLPRAILLVLATTAIGAAGPEPHRLTRLAAVAFASAGLAVGVGSGHAAADGGAAVVAVGAHLVVAGCWLGAIPAVLVSVRQGPEVAERTLRTFSRAATWLLVATVVAGVVSAAILAGGIGSVSRDWGLILIAKLVFVVMAALAGAWNRFNVIPHLRTLRPIDVRAPLLLEGALLVAIVTASIALTHNGPPREADAAPAGRAPGEPIVLGAEDDEVTVTLVLDPGEVGTNDVHLYVVDRVGMPLDVEEATMTLASEELGIAAIPVPLSPVGTGHYSTRTDDLGLAGTWEVSVVVRPTTFTQIDVSGPVEINPPSGG